MVIKRTFILVLVLLSAISLQCEVRSPRVLNGIDVLREQNFELLAGKRVGLITNHTGVALDGTTTKDLLFGSKVCELVALFSPEHGIAGALDAEVNSSKDSSTGIPIHSLYGKTKRPTPEMLQDIDVLVFDIQDIGARFYTYATTMAYCMEEAAKAHIPFIVLDRPNPLGGTSVEGPMLDQDKSSFVGYMPLPVRHGMTVGELARYFNDENKIGARLRVIEMKGWQRSFYFWDTGQLWINPSPNMRNILAAILYPGICLLERTNVSVGRGTDRPFEIIGAPWIEPRHLAAYLNRAEIGGIRIVPTFFVPESSVHGGIRCGGVNLLLTEPEKLNSVLLGLTLVSALRDLYPDNFEMDGVMDLLGNAGAMKRLKAGESPEAIFQNDDRDFRNFLSKRRASLIYDIARVRKEGEQP